MTRMIGSALVTAILAAGCTAEDTRARSQDRIAGEPQRPKPPLSTQGAANVLIFGDGNVAHINNLRTWLQGLGHTAVIRPDFRLPPTIEELSQFHTVWHVGADDPLTSQEQALLIDYLEAGGGVHLTGETEGSDSMNDTLTAIVRGVVEGAGSIVIGRRGSVPGFMNSLFYLVNEDASGGVATTPNQVSAIELLNAGGISGLPLTSPNVLATGGFFGDVVVGAIWQAHDMSADAGTLSIVMDSEWLSRLPNANNQNGELVENLQQRLTGTPVVNLPPEAVAVIPSGQNLDCNDDGEVREVVPVELDGSGSSDPDNGPSSLTYTWFENGVPIGFGVNPTVNLDIGNHTIVLVVGDGADEGLDSISLTITCTVDCTPGGSLFTRCHPGCPCDHGEGDCDTEDDCLPGLVCLHDAGFAFGYQDDEVDVCSNVCPSLGVGSWNYCSPQCPCDVGEGDCEDDIDCLPGLECESDIGPAFGFQREVDICVPR